MRKVALAVGVAVLVGVGVLWLQPGSPPAVPGPVGATLAVLTGSAELTRAGAASAVVARGGDGLRVGDRVATGPGTRARLAFVSGDQVRLDSGTSIRLAAVDTRATAFEQLAGRTWNRMLSAGGAAYSVVALGRTVHGRGRYTEFSVTSSGSGLAVDVLGGSVWSGDVPAAAGQQLLTSSAKAARVGPLPEADLNATWTLINQALDVDPSADGPAAIGSGELLPGEESSPQQAVTIPGSATAAPDIVFTAGWQTGSLELTVLDPDGAVFDRVSGTARSISIGVPGARPGGWQYRVRQLDATGGADDWFVLVSVVFP
jgi:hypothetical protein